MPTDRPVVELVVDVANLVGSRPDGWWRDRQGATERTLAWLAALAGRQVPGAGRVQTVTAVVEGAARRARAPDTLTVLRAAPGQTGDDVIAAHVAGSGGRTQCVVTADRGLRARLPDGVTVLGPGILLRVRDSLRG